MKVRFLFLTSFLLSSICFAQQTNRRPDPATILDCHNPYNPVILSHPSDQTICPGTSVSFTASAPTQSGSSWEMSTDNGLTWSSGIENAVYSFGNDTDTLTLLSVSSQMNGYRFRCFYFGTCHGFSITNTATLTVSANPIQLIAPPNNITTCKSNAADFIVTATGSSLWYQWQQSIDGGTIFTDIPARNSALLHFDSVSISMNDTRYRCIISSSCAATVTTDPVTLTVSPVNTVIVTQPADQIVCPGNTANYYTSATGQGIFYQWQKSDFSKNFVDIPGATSAQLSVPWVSIDSNAGFYYRCRIVSNCNTIYTAEVTANYISAPLLDDAIEKFACDGDFVNFKAVDYSQDTQYTFQWQCSRDGGNTYFDSTGANSNYLSIPVSARLNHEKYRCHISNSCFDGFSNIMSLYVDAPTEIIAQPLNSYVCNTAFSAQFKVVAIGSIAEYRWQKSSDAGATFNDLLFGIGLSTPELTLEDITAAQNNEQYRCKIISNCFPTLYSSVATLTINSSPELGADTAVFVLCDTCQSDITHLYSNSAAYTSVAWDAPDATNALPGKYSITVHNNAGCYKTAKIYVNVSIADTVKICKGSNTNITANITGSAYQWQVNSGNGFINLTDDNITNGSTSPNLFIRNMQGNMLVRCLVNGNTYSDLTYVKLTAYWNGSVSDHWNEPANWNCGEVPDANTEVYILRNTQYSPEIESGGATCKKLIMANGTSLELKPGINFKISGK